MLNCQTNWQYNSVSFKRKLRKRCACCISAFNISVWEGLSWKSIKQSWQNQNGPLSPCHLGMSWYYELVIGLPSHFDIHHLYVGSNEGVKWFKFLSRSNSFAESVYHCINMVISRWETWHPAVYHVSKMFPKFMNSSLQELSAIGKDKTNNIHYVSHWTFSWTF